MLNFLGTLLFWAFILGLVYFGFKIVHALVTKPNLRYYAAKTLKDIKYMYYRYHV